MRTCTVWSPQTSERSSVTGSEFSSTQPWAN